MGLHEVELAWLFQDDHVYQSASDLVELSIVTAYREDRLQVTGFGHRVEALPADHFPFNTGAMDGTAENTHHLPPLGFAGTGLARAAEDRRLRTIVETDTLN